MRLIALLLIMLSTVYSQDSYAHGDDKHTHFTREQVAWQKISQGALLIDTRTASEHSEKSLSSAINIPYQDIVEKFKLLEIRKDRDVVFYDRSGNRSGKAIINLRKAGYTNLHNGGGIDALLTAKP